MTKDIRKYKGVLAMSELKDINYQSLSKSLSNDDIAKFRLENSSNKFFISKKLKDILLLVDGVVILCLLVFAIIIYMYVAPQGEDGSSVSLATVWSLLILLQGPLSFGLIVLIIYGSQVKFWQKYIRLFCFAKDNGLSYIPSATGYHRQGIIFERGYSRKIIDSISSSVEGEIIYEFANYESVVGSKDDKKVYRDGYIMVQLQRNLPHIVLDSKANNHNFLGKNYSNLAMKFDKNQKLSLEGDFDKYFTLYAPKEYEQDALYVFTPDLMALFIDESSPYDAEIIDNKLYIYSNKHFNLQDIATIERIFKIIFLVGGKALAQTNRYSDERVGNRASDVIEKSGRRLKKDISVAVIIVVIVSVILYVAIVASFIFSLKIID